jgi:hypothetical protein
MDEFGYLSVLLSIYEAAIIRADQLPPAVNDAANHDSAD